jgi:hypothetical protein
MAGMGWCINTGTDDTLWVLTKYILSATVEVMSRKTRNIKLLFPGLVAEAGIK